MVEMKTVNINDLISPEWNPRTITAENFEKLKKSLSEKEGFGYVQPVLINTVNNHIVSGNQRVEALKELGHTKIKVNTVHMPDLAKEKALALQLNNHYGKYDEEKTNNILQELDLIGFDTTLTGFDNLDILESNLLADIDYDTGISEENYIDIDSEKEDEKTTNKTITCPYCGKEIDI